MRYFKRWAVWFMSLALLSSAAPVTAKADSDKDQVTEIKKQLSKRKKTGYAEGEALVLYRTTVSGQKNRSVPFSSGIKVKKVWNFPADIKGKTRTRSQDSVVSIARVSSGKSTDELVRQLKKDPQVIAAQPNYKIRLLGGSDPYFDFQWANKNQGQNGGSAGKDAGYEQFYEKTSGTKGKETVVAVVDTGIDLEHEDLKNRLWTNKSDVIAGKHGYDFANSDADPSDDYGHGTHCAGIIAAQAGNGKGVAGISQSSDIKLMALKVFDEDGGGEVSNIVDAYYYIYKQQLEGVNVAAVNNSWGADEAEEQELMKYLVDLVGKKGAVTVCAAGNEGEDNERTTVIPAGIDSDYVISVAATNENDGLAFYSNYGKESVHMAAPGNQILSTVSDDCFNPTIYNSKEKNANCQFMKDFNDGDVSDIKTEEAGSTGKGTVTVSADSTYFGKESSGKSAKISVKGAKAGEIYTVFIPYDSTKGSTDSHLSTMLKAVSSSAVEDGAGLVMAKDYKLDEDGQIVDPLTLEEAAANMILGNIPVMGVNGEMDAWEHLTYPSRSITKNEKRAVGISLVALDDQDFTLYLDDTAVSKAGVSSQSFEKYDFYSGTSMAAPLVSGAVANTSWYYGKKDALANREAVLGMTRTVKNLPVITKGVLDGRKLADQNPILIRAVVSGGKVVLSGKGFGAGSGTVKVNGKTEKTASWSDSKIVLENRQLVNRVGEVEIRTKSGKTVTGSFYFVKGKSGPKKVFSTEDITNGGDVVSDGRKLYYLDRDLNLYVMDEEEQEFSRVSAMSREKAFAGIKKGELDRADLDLDSVPVYCDKAVYAIAEADLGYEIKRSLVCYSFQTKSWSRIDSYLSKTGGAKLQGSALAAYNGKIYVIGGRNKKTGSLEKNVFCYDTGKKQWSKAAALPEGRYQSAAVQSGNQMILTLGSSGKKGEIPKNLVYSDKNKRWVKKSASLTPRNKDRELYTASVGVCRDGIAYVGLDTDSFGNVFWYSVSKDRYEAMNYQASFDEEMTGTTVGSRFLLMPVSVQDDFDYKNLRKKKTTVRSKAQSDEDDEDYDDSSTVYSYPVTSGLVTVKAKTKHGTISGKGNYLPGQKVTVKPKAAKYYCFKPSTLKAGGKKVKGTSYSFRITGNVSVSAVFKKTVVKLNKKKLTLSAGRKYRLKAKVKTAGKKKSVTWKSSRSKYATVSKKGVVRAKKAGRGKTVTIYARAKDGSKSYAKVKIRIR
ncbi:S8 family serine peptidase [Anaerostipes sp.]|uniref:S8 family serine peptidase n=1 Tax=Anaerostipes sp. TaxID=1872530 RepID=UPI0025C15460|nr:S8 family serine peptidase [Anaerostipes sp.]